MLVFRTLTLAGDKIMMENRSNKDVIINLFSEGRTFKLFYFLKNKRNTIIIIIIRENNIITDKKIFFYTERRTDSLCALSPRRPKYDLFLIFFFPFIGKTIFAIYRMFTESPSLEIVKLFNRLGKCTFFVTVPSFVYNFSFFLFSWLVCSCKTP